MISLNSSVFITGRIEHFTGAILGGSLK